MPKGGNGTERGFAALLVGSAIVLTADEIGSGTLAPSRYIGLMAAFLMLSLISPFQPELARGLAWLVFIAILLTRGPRVFTRLTRQTRGTR